MKHQILRSAIFIFLLVVTACSGSDGSLLNDDNAETAPPPTVEEYVTHIIETLGNTVGFDAIYLAFDNGYSLDQVSDAGLNNRLGTAGIISDGNGGIVAPENPPADPAGKLVSNVSTDLVALRGWLESEANEGKNTSAEGSAMVMMLTLVERGYDAEQIVEAFLFGYSLKEHWIPSGIGTEEIPVMAIFDENNNIVEPNRAVNTTAFSPPETETGGATGGGTTSGGNGGGTTGGADGCLINDTTILGSWSNPRTPVTIGYGALDACTYTFNADGTGSKTCDQLGGQPSFTWDVRCNEVDVIGGGNLGNGTWSVTSAVTMEFNESRFGVTLVMTKN